MQLRMPEIEIKHSAVNNVWTQLDVLHMDGIVKEPATSYRKPKFVDVQVVVLKGSPAHEVLKMVCESEEPMHLRTGESDHGTWAIKETTGRSRSSEVTLTLGFCSY